MNYHELYDNKYRAVRSAGWSGWGSKCRDENGWGLINRLMANPLIPKTGSCLELGCGEGQLSRKLSQLGFTVTGVDISSVAISWAIEKQRHFSKEIDFFQTDLSVIGDSISDSFDFILDGHCLHCIPGPCRATFLANIRGYLSDDGIFVVSSRCGKDSDVTIMDSGLMYRHFYKPDALYSELKEAGFNILDVTEYDRDTQIHVDVVLQKI